MGCRLCLVHFLASVDIKYSGLISPVSTEDGKHLSIDQKGRFDKPHTTLTYKYTLQMCIMPPEHHTNATNSWRCLSQCSRMSSMSILTWLALISFWKTANSLGFLHNISTLITFSILNWQAPPLFMEPLLLYPPRLFCFPLPLPL